MRASSIYVATDISPDGKTVLITSNAHNGYDNVGLLDIANQKIDWLTSDKWEINAGSFSPDGSTLTWAANVDGNTEIYVYDVAGKHAEALPLSAGVNSLGGNPITVFARRIEAALLPQRPDRSQRCLDLRPQDQAVAAGDALAGRRNPQRRHGRALPRPLSQPRRQVDHLGFRLRAQQHSAQREVPRHRVHPRRARPASSSTRSTVRFSTSSTRAISSSRPTSAAQPATARSS